MKNKNIVILILFALLFILPATQEVRAQATQTIPVIEEVSFTDGGITEIDTLEMSLPVNYQAGDLLVMILCADNPQTGAFFEAVADWTKLDEAGNSFCDTHIAVYYQLTNGSTASVTITTTTTANILGWILRISGIDSTDIIEASTFGVSTAAGTNPHNIAGVTTYEDNCLVIYGLSFDGGDGYPYSVTAPFLELDNRANAGSPLEAYVSGTFGFRNLIARGASTTAVVYTNVLDGAAYFQVALNGGIAATTTVSSGILYELFLSPELWGYLGPIAIVIIGYFVAKQEYWLGILWFVVECLIIGEYLALVGTSPAYWWHIIILLLGGIFACVLPLLDRKW